MTHISNWPDVMNNKQVRKAATFVYTTFGINYYIHNGKRVGQKKFEKMFPIEFTKINVKGDNPDKTKITY